MSEPRLPNLVVVGAAKSGTTSLHNYLSEHPDVYMAPKKETHFLIFECKTPAADDVGPDPIRTWDEYRAQFAGVSGEKVVGEASPGYLCDPDVPRQIKKLLPDARAVAILRNPIDRAYSSFTRAIDLGEEELDDMLEAIRREPVDEPDVWDGSRRYVRQGFYHRQLERYYAVLPRDRVAIWLYDDLQADAGRLMRELFEFLEVDPGFTPNTRVEHNVTFRTKSAGLHRLMTERHAARRLVDSVVPNRLREWARPLARRVREGNIERGARMLPAVRAELLRLYRDEILRLQDQIDRDLSHWIREG